VTVRPPPAAAIEARLAMLLGPNMARTALRVFSARALGKTPEALTAADAPKLLAALRPSLRTLLGADATERVIDEITREL
jgi:hypothetical protein